METRLNTYYAPAALAHGIETTRLIGSRFWQSLRSEIKEFRDFEVFKKSIKIGKQANATVGFAKHLSKT